jgi:hypothetical protein
MSISSAVNFSLKVTETLTAVDAPLIDTADATIRTKIDRVVTLTAASSPDAELNADMEIAMTAGAATIDFTALTKRGGVAVSFNGKAVRAVAFKNPATNANPITIVEGAANGLPLLGASFSLTLQPGQEHFSYLGTGGTTVAGTDKTIDITGTGSQVLQMIAIAG